MPHHLPRIRPGSRRAIRAATMATQGAQEITGTGGLPATGRKGDGELVRRSGRQQALQADAAAFGFSASRVGWRPVCVLAGVRRGRSGGHNGERGASEARSGVSERDARDIAEAD